MPKIGPLELVLILVIVLLLFGAGRIPEIGASIGKGIRAFKRGITGEEEKKAADKPATGEEKPPTATKT
jgi:sec-independent protein translocase protein TatA